MFIAAFLYSIYITNLSKIIVWNVKALSFAILLHESLIIFLSDEA